MKKILVIEDDSFMREEVIRECLETEGYFVITTESWASGYEIAMEELPDLIVCNYYLPGLRGFEVYGQYHKNFLLRKIPLVFTSALFI